RVRRIPGGVGRRISAASHLTNNHPRPNPTKFLCSSSVRNRAKPWKVWKTIALHQFSEGNVATNHFHRISASINRGLLTSSQGFLHASTFHTQLSVPVL